MSLNLHLVSACPALAEPCISHRPVPTEDAPGALRPVEASRDGQEGRPEDLHEAADGLAVFFDPDLDVPRGDADTRWVKSPFGRHVIVNAKAIEFFICTFDEATADQIPPDFEERLLSTAAPALAAEFMVRRGRLEDLIELLERAQDACEHILASEDPLGQGFLAQVQRLAQAANVKHAANTALAEIDAEAARS